MKHTAQYWIDHLQLEEHTAGGYIREIYRSTHQVKSAAKTNAFVGNRVFSNHLYYLLCGGQQSLFISTKLDESWSYFQGSSALIVHMISPQGKYQRIVLGPNIEKGEVFQLVIPATYWYAAHLQSFCGFALLGVSCSPGFEEEDLIIGEYEPLIKKFPQHQGLIRRFAKK